MTTIYLVRHSKPFHAHRGIEEITEDLLTSNIKSPLSVIGENLAKASSGHPEFLNLDAVWSSDYVRAMCTAKYFAYRNKVKVNISNKLGERVHGVTSWDQLPDDYEYLQLIDENYKINDGESQKEVRGRMFSFITRILNNYNGKRVLVVSHATAITFLLIKWCEIRNGKFYFKGEEVFDGKWHYCEAFKLTFSENNILLNIEHIE